MKTILVGISGFSERWVKIMLGTKDIEVAACVDIADDKLADLCKTYSYPRERCFASLKSALQNTEADSVIVTIPTKYHYSAAREALEAGKHVLVEKPLALTLAEAKSLTALARKKKKTLSVVSQHRFAPYLQVMKAYCQHDGVLGRPRSFFIRIHMNRPASYYDVAARCQGPGVLAIQGVHALDWIHWLFGKAASCSASIGTLVHNTPNEDTAAALIAMRTGIMGILDINHITRGADELSIKIFFEKGTLFYGNNQIIEESNGSNKEIEFQKVNPQFDSLKDQLMNFVQAIEGTEPLAVTAADGLNVMTLLDALYKSTKKLNKVHYAH